jgi:hypothetical protein
MNEDLVPLKKIIQKVQNNSSMTLNLYKLFQHLIMYNNITHHKTNKLIYIYIITPDDIYYDANNNIFIYNTVTLSLNYEGNYEKYIWNILKEKENYLYVHPELNKIIKSSNGEIIQFETLKTNKYLSWSIAMIILNILYRNYLSEEYIKEQYSNSLLKDDIIDFKLNQIIKKCYLNEMAILEKLLYYKEDEEEELINNFYSLY